MCVQKAAREVYLLTGRTVLDHLVDDGEDSAFIVFASVEDAKAARAARNGQPLKEGSPASLVQFATRRDKTADLKSSGSRAKDLHISGLGCRTTGEELHAFCHHHTDGLVGSQLSEAI